MAAHVFPISFREGLLKSPPFALVSRQHDEPLLSYCIGFILPLGYCIRSPTSTLIILLKLRKRLKTLDNDEYSTLTVNGMIKSSH